MKKIIAVLFFLIIASNVKSQGIKFRVKSCSVNFTSSKNERDWSDCQVIIVLDTIKSKLKIYNNETEYYDILNLIKKKELNGNIFLTYKLLDTKAKELTMAFVVVQNQKYDFLIVIDDGTYSWAYKMDLD